MDRIALDHIKGFIGQRIHALQAPIRSEHGKPLGKQQINLARVFPQGRKTGGIRRVVKSGADPLFCVQRNLRGRRLRLAVAAKRSGPLPFLSLFFFLFLQCMLGPGLHGPLELGEWLAAQGTVDKEDHQQHGAYTQHIK